MLEIRALPQLSLVFLTTEATERNCAMDGVDPVTISTPLLHLAVLSQLPAASYFLTGYAFLVTWSSSRLIRQVAA
jgi:hypothetical protein